jgi:hypothetical protein
MFMKLPQAIDRVLELSEALFRYRFQEQSLRPPPLAGDNSRAEIAPAPQEEELRTLRLSFTPGVLYLVCTAVEMSKGYIQPCDFLSLYAHFSDYFPDPSEVVERLMEHPRHLASKLEGGLFLLHEAGVDVYRLLEPCVSRS